MDKDITYNNPDSILKLIQERKLSFGSDFLDEYYRVDAESDVFNEEDALDAYDFPEREIKIYKRKPISVRKAFLVLIKVVSVISALLIISAFIGYNVFALQSKDKSREIYKELRQIKNDSMYLAGKYDVDDVLPEYIPLQGLNPSFSGWVSINLTSVDYPIIYRPDGNFHYYFKDFYGGYNADGVLTLDKSCNPDKISDNMVILGHNMPSGAMFGALRKYLDEGYAKDHELISFDTLNQRYQYKIFAVYTEKNSVFDGKKLAEYKAPNLSDKKKFEKYISYIKNQSLYLSEDSVEYGDKLITLATDDVSIFGKRIVVVGKMVNDIR